MVKRYLGATIASFLLAGLASLLLSGVAYAEDDPAIAADCAVDLPGEDGGELAVDAGLAVAGLDVGLSAEPVTDELPAVGGAASAVLGAEIPAVAEAADGTCGLVQTTAKTANEVGESVRVLMRHEATGPPVDEPAPPVDAPAENLPPDEEPPQEPEDTAEAVEGDVLPVEAPAYEPVAYTTESVAPLPAVELPAIPPAAAQRGPDLDSGQDGSFSAEKNAGRAHALPLQPAEQPKLPFLLAIAALAAVAAVLVRRWITRSVG